MVVFVASPYRHGNRLENVQRQIWMGHTLMDYGYTPILPLLMHYMEELRSRPDDEYRMADLELIEKSDAVLRLEGMSTGADAEVAYAETLGIPVVYDIAELAKVERGL